MTKAVGLRNILDNTTFTRWNIFKASLDEFKEGVFTPFFPSTSRSWSSFVTSNFFWEQDCQADQADVINIQNKYTCFTSFFLFLTLILAGDNF